VSRRADSETLRASPEALSRIAIPAAGGAPEPGVLGVAGKAPGAWGRPIGYAVSAALVGLITAIGVAVSSRGNLTNLALLYLIPVMAAATFYGLRTGLFAGLLSSLAYNFFFLPPLHSFTVEDPENILTIIVLLGVAVVTSQLAARVRLQADLAQRSAAENAALASFARTLAGLSTVEELGRALSAELSHLLGADVVLLVPGDDGRTRCAPSAPDLVLGAIDAEAVERAMAEGRSAQGSEWRFQPLAAGGRALGVVGIAAVNGGEPAPGDRPALIAGLIDQAALALGRINLVAETANIAQLEERDRLRAALLSSLSHDLRTPLTTILSAAGQIRAARCDGLDPALTESLVAEAERLNRFVANLLDMARFEAGALRLQQEAVDLTDAVAAAVHDLRNRLHDHPIRLEVPVDLPLVRVDPQLLHHCLINLLDNAGKYSNPGGAVTISGTRGADAVTLAIIDEGPGLPEAGEEALFETFGRLEGSDRRGGTGLGLAIVKGFAEAMGMRVAAANRSDCKGAIFSLSFPEALFVHADEEPAP